MKLTLLIPVLAVSFETTHANVEAQEDFSLPGGLSLSVVLGILPGGSSSSNSKAGKSAGMSVASSSKAGKSASMSIASSSKAGKSTDTCGLSFEPDKANAERLQFTKSISVNEGTCSYMGVIEFNAPEANLDSGAVVLALYDLGDEFQRATGFNHVAFDYYPNGHPTMANWGKAHIDFHLMRITPKERECMACDLFALAPVCDWRNPQSKPSGKKYFITGRDEGSGMIANMPAGFAVDIGSAVPGSGIHAYDFDSAPLVENWFDPVLIMGIYDAGISFWEPMFPYSFVSGSEDNFYEANEVYVQQTLSTLPSYWSMSYSKETQVTTVIIKGIANGCD